ncbi:MULTISPECIES: hypothetical protein [unclassified Microbacterium]|uniref:hypothetical protein n=1 Tax=unclassified Microbacterium TaxID=2609290 RepID=UPI00049388C2|nr:MULTISPECIES: hypothetical protein [unclassified Microbacterium]
MNKTIIYIVFAVLAALGIVGTLALLFFRPDATATFTAFVIQILGIAAVAAGTFYGFGKTNEKLEAVERQTNGNLSRRDAEIERLTAVNIELAKQVPPSSDAEHGR